MAALHLDRRRRLQLLPAPGPLGAIAALQKDNRYLQELMAPDRYDAAWQA